MFSFSEVAIVTIGLKYVYNLVEIYLQLGWNISENPTDHSGPSFIEVGESKRGSKMNIHNFLKYFLKIWIWSQLGWNISEDPAHHNTSSFSEVAIFTMCVFIFFTMFLDLFFISEYDNW